MDPATREGISEGQVLEIPWEHPAEQGYHWRRHIRWQAGYEAKQILQGWEHTPSRRVEPKRVEVLGPTPDGEQAKRLATADELGQRREEVRVLDASSDFRHPNGEVAKEWKRFCMGPESRGRGAAQLTRQTKGLELMPVGKNLVERIPLEYPANVEVSEVSYGDEGRGVGPRTILDGQRPDLSFDVLQEFVKT